MEVTTGFEQVLGGCCRVAKQMILGDKLRLSFDVFFFADWDVIEVSWRKMTQLCLFVHKIIVASSFWVQSTFEGPILLLLLLILSTCGRANKDRNR